MESRLLSRENSILIVIDMQEKLLPHVEAHEDILRRVRLLVSSAKRLGVPIVATEQYPKGLGPTVPEVAEVLGDVRTVVKTEFSCAAVPEFMSRLGAPGRQVVVCGIEAHICVSQTAVELAAAGWRVFVVLDAIGSRRGSDRDAAVSRMSQEGIAPMTAEAVVFEWLRKAGGEDFKAVQGWVKGIP